MLRLQARQHRQLRLAALLEGASLLLLVFVAVPLKHLAHFPLASAVMGPLHGLLLIIYLWVAFCSAGLFGWPARRALSIAWPAFIPFGTFVVWRVLKREAGR